MGTGIQSTPQTDHNHFGIELEFLLPNAIVNDSLILLNEKFKTIDAHIAVQFESITMDDDFGFEVKVLCKEEQAKETMQKVIDILNTVNAQVNNKCGLHIHVDSRLRDKTELFKKIVRNQTALFNLVAEHRKNNEYCVPIVNEDISNSEHNKWQSKHNAIHVSRLYNTVEVRMFESTLDTNKINLWIDTLLGIIYNKETIAA